MDNWWCDVQGWKRNAKYSRKQVSVKKTEHPVGENPKIPAFPLHGRLRMTRATDQQSMLIYGDLASYNGALRESFSETYAYWVILK